MEIRSIMPHVQIQSRCRARAAAKKKKKKGTAVHHGRSVRRMGTHYESFGYGEMDTRKTQHEQISK
jgi:hypothetical protein